MSRSVPFKLGFAELLSVSANLTGIDIGFKLQVWVPWQLTQTSRTITAEI